MSNISDLKHYGTDAEDKLLKILSEQLAREIDKEIITSLRKMPGYRRERIKKILNKI